MEGKITPEPTLQDGTLPLRITAPLPEGTMGHVRCNRHRTSPRPDPAIHLHPGRRWDRNYCPGPDTGFCAEESSVWGCPSSPRLRLSVIPSLFI